MIVSLLFVLCPGLLPAGRCRSAAARLRPGPAPRGSQPGSGEGCPRDAAGGDARVPCLALPRVLSSAAPSRSPRSRGGRRAAPRRSRAPPRPALLLLLADGRGVRLLLPPRHHLDQHPRVSKVEGFRQFPSAGFPLVRKKGREV